MWKPSVQNNGHPPAPINRPLAPAPPPFDFVRCPIQAPCKLQAPCRLFDGLTFFVQWRKDESQADFYACLDQINNLGGRTVKLIDDPSITHFILAIPAKHQQELFLPREVLGGSKFKQVVRYYSKWVLPRGKMCDEDRNKAEGRTRMVVWREWLGEALNGRLKLDNEGKWGIYLISDADNQKLGLVLQGRNNQLATRVAIDPRIRQTSAISAHSRADYQSSSYIATPPPSPSMNALSQQRRPTMEQQSSLGTKRPRPRPSSGCMEGPLAKRPSLPCMQPRSRSDSPLTPAPDDTEIFTEEDEEGLDGEMVMDLEIPSRDVSPDLNGLDEDLGSEGDLGLDEDSGSEEDLGLEEDSGSEDCEPEEYDEAANANIKYIQATDLLAFDLHSMMMDWDLTPAIAKTLGT